MTKRILVVDDEKYILNILDFSLGGEGFDVITAANGEEALTKSVDLHPDLIVLDVMMPKIDGFEVCRALKTKSDTKDIPIVILTAKDRDEDRKKGEEVGVDRYMTKPFSPGRLVELVHELLGLEQLD
jgi:two-component system alkaline phosphatase synthesis response regulator PhoP